MAVSLQDQQSWESPGKGWCVGYTKPLLDLGTALYHCALALCILVSMPIINGPCNSPKLITVSDLPQNFHL